MIVCKGDGSLMFHPVNEDLVWAEVCSSIASWCSQNGYKDATKLEQQLNLDPREIPLESCTECPEYKKCISYCDNDSDGDAEQLDPMYCSAIDEIATASQLSKALAALDPDIRAEMLGEHMGDYE